MGTFIELTGAANDISPKDPKMTNPLNLEEFDCKITTKISMVMLKISMVGSR